MYVFYIVSACVAVLRSIAAPSLIAATTAEPYKSGQATELLEQSIQKLKVHETDDFRAQAGKIISFMLENRLPSGAKTTTATANTQQPQVPPPVVDKKTPGPPPPKAQLPPLAYASETHFEDRFPKPNALHTPSTPSTPPPPPPPPSTLPPLSLHMPHSDYGTSPTLAAQTPTMPPTPPLPLPPPPPPSLLATTVEQERAPVILRQRNGGVKSAHARDRRSFIDNADGGTIYNALNNNINNVPATLIAPPLPMGTQTAGERNGNESAEHDVGAGGEVAGGGQSVTDAVCGNWSTISDDGLWNGTPPVCCVCQTRIQR